MISSEDKALASLISSVPVDISEYCFSNLFCFQKEHNFEYTSISSLPFIIGESQTIQYLMPLFVPSKESIPKIKIAMKSGRSLYPIPEEWVALFKEDPKFSIAAYEKDFDYVFLTDRLSEMSGGKLSKKRNLIAQFTKACQDIEIKTFSTETKDDAITILETWTKDNSDDKTNTDYSSCMLGINNFETLNLTGIILYSSKNPIAFTLGEITRNDYILHFAKANIRCKGAYQYLFQQTARCLQNAIWVNFEQDLGVPSLQKMKSSYYPDKLIKKYTISLASNL